MMWDALLDTMNMSYYHLLIKNLIWPIARQIEPGRKSKERYREKEGSVRKKPAATGEDVK